jgi:trehalose-phosphatase
VIQEILKRTSVSGPAALFLDYDGTLTRIRANPQLAFLPPARRKILGDLSRRLFITVISGRSLADIRFQVGVPTLAYSGTHGLEIDFHGSEWRHPNCAEVTGILPPLATKIKSRLRSCPGLLVENKGCSIAVHFRLTPRSFHGKIAQAIREASSPFQDRILVTRGKMVLEIRPACVWDKGSAVRKIAEMAGVWEQHPLVYIGDDSTDEDAFAALADTDIAIHVGKGSGSCAQFRLGNVAEVWKLIEKFLDQAMLLKLKRR